MLVTADAKSKIYGSANPAFTATLAGLVNGDTEASLDTPVALTTTAAATSPAGNYDIVPAGAADANYTVSFANGSLTVTPAALTVTADNAARPYGQTNPLFTVIVSFMHSYITRISIKSDCRSPQQSGQYLPAIRPT